MARQSQPETDIRLRLGQQRFRPVYTAATRERVLVTGEGRRQLEDFDTISGDDNLGQAVIMRLLTPRGELEALGHPSYGSRLHELVGTVNTETTRDRVRLYILEALAHESRIEKILAITVTAHPWNRDVVTVDLRLRPRGSDTVLELGPFSLRLQS